MTLTDMTYDQLLERLERLKEAGLLNFEDKIALSIGQGKATKTITGVKIEADGKVVLVASGHEAKALPASLKAKVGKAQPA